MLPLSGITRYGVISVLVAFALSSCSTQQSAPTGEKEPPSPREVTKEVTRTVTVAETPKAPEAEKETRAAPVPAERPPVEGSPDYVTVADGALSIEVPSSWSEVETGKDSEAGGSWSEFSGESVDYSLTAAPSLDSWSNTPGTPGIYAVTSAGLAQRYANEELVAAGPNDLSGSCESGTQRAFEREPYSGFVQEWANCFEAGSGYLTLAATPRDGECVVLLQVGTAGQEGAEAGQHALDTFGADCGATPFYPQTPTEEQYVPEQDAENSEPMTPTPQYAPEDVPLTDQDISNADECAVRGLDFDPESNKCVTPADLEETCAALGKVRAGRGCVFPEDASNVPLTDAEEGTDEIEVPEPPGDEERVPLPTDQYEPPEPSPQNPGYEVADEPPVPSEPPPSSSGYPPFPGDPFNGPTCVEVGGGPYSVPPGSPRDSNGDGVACE